MFPNQWSPPCGQLCNKKYDSFTKIPWRIFCKKGCNADGENWEECLAECNQICYKDPVFKDHEWSAYIDRSPGHEDYSLECFSACVSGCGFKDKDYNACLTKNRSCAVFQSLCCPFQFSYLFGFFRIAHLKSHLMILRLWLLMMQFDKPAEKAEQVRPNRPPKPKPPVVSKPPPSPPADPTATAADIPSTSA